MGYAIVDVEVAAPLPTVALAPDQNGLALLLRRGGRPISFSLHELPPGVTLTPDEFAALLLPGSAADVVADVVREEIAPPPAPPTSRSVTIAICTHNRSSLLERCLASLWPVVAGAAGEPTVEILVVDNAPRDDSTAAAVRHHPQVRYVRESRAGLDFARNRALREATGDVIAFLDDDVEVDRGWLAGLLEALAEHGDAAAVTGLVLPYELRTAAQVIFERRGGFRRGCVKLRYAGARLPGNPLYPVGAGIFGAGCNMALDRRTVLEMGGFDEALDTGAPLPGGGDLDIFYRVVRSGAPLVYEPRMLVFHKHRREYEALRRQYWTWGTGFMAFVAKTYGRDATQRGKLRALIGWWLFDRVRELRRSTGGPGPLGPDLVLAELFGGLVGLAGTYSRSQRRSAKIAARAVSVAHEHQPREATA